MIDLDAAAKISEVGSGESYVGSKFSSAVLPPECFAKLDADQAKHFEAYFKDDDAELREKVAPKVDRHGASYVVKTFSLDEKGDPKNVDGLPYELVEASEARGKAIDYWSLGALFASWSDSSRRTTKKSCMRASAGSATPTMGPRCGRNSKATNLNRHSRSGPSSGSRNRRNKALANRSDRLLRSPWSIWMLMRRVKLRARPPRQKLPTVPQLRRQPSLKNSPP